MTDEQLAEIERYGEARLRVGDAATAQILLLVKALREARAELKERQETLEQAVAERASALAERNWANDRYDEARAEVERLRGALRPTGHDPETCCCPDCCTLRKVTEERDRALAALNQYRPDWTVFVGPCKHGFNPYTRCETCVMLPPQVVKRNAQSSGQPVGGAATPLEWRIEELVAEVDRLAAHGIKLRDSREAMADIITLTRERDEARALLAALKEEHRPADEIRAQLLAEIEAHAATKAEVERLRDIVAVNDQRLADVWDTAKRVLKGEG